jgi:hypothetical protein
MYKIRWLRDGKKYDIGGLALFAPGATAAIAGHYVAGRVWPQIYRDHPELSGFALVEMASLDEVFRWSPVAIGISSSAESGRDRASPGPP